MARTCGACFSPLNPNRFPAQCPVDELDITTAGWVGSSSMSTGVAWLPPPMRMAFLDESSTATTMVVVFVWGMVGWIPCSHDCKCNYHTHSFVGFCEMTPGCPRKVAVDDWGMATAKGSELRLTCWHRLFQDSSRELSCWDRSASQMKPWMVHTNWCFPVC